MARSYSTRERILAVLATRTQKQAARFLGVSERTIRRWKNEEVFAPIPRHDKKLKRRSRDEREKLTRQDRRVAKEIPIPRRIPTVKMSRRELAVRDREGRDTGRVRPSDWLTLHTEHLTSGEIARLLMGFQSQGHYMFQVIYTVPRGGDYADPVKGAKLFKKSRNVSTAIEDLSAYTEMELIEFLDHLRLANAKNYVRKIPYVFIQPLRFKHRG